MRIIALLLMTSLTGWAHSPGCAWNCSGVPVGQYPRVIVRNPGVSTGAAVASAIAAGVIGWELGRRQQSKSKPQVAAPPANASCQIVKIQDEQRLVCRDERGNWQVQ